MNHRMLTSSQLELRTKVIETYIDLGMKLGFSHVLLDEIAAQLSISKKTIYKLFDNKEALVAACIDYVFESIDAAILPVAQDPNLNIIEKIKKLLALVADKLSFFSVEQVYEIEAIYPSLWEHIMRERSIRLARYGSLFEAAIREGLIKDYNPQILVQLLMVSIEHFTKESIMAEHHLTYSQALTLVSDIIFNGILLKE